MRYDHSFYLTLFGNASQGLYPDNTVAAFTQYLPRPIQLSSDERWEVGLCELTCPPPNSGTFVKRNVPVVISLETAFIYCDLIAPQIVDDSLVRCLRTYIFPSAGCPCHFHNVYYMPLEKHTIHNVRIEVLTQ